MTRHRILGSGAISTGSGRWGPSRLRNEIGLPMRGRGYARNERRNLSRMRFTFIYRYAARTVVSRILDFDRSKFLFIRCSTLEGVCRCCCSIDLFNTYDNHRRWLRHIRCRCRRWVEGISHDIAVILRSRVTRCVAGFNGAQIVYAGNRVKLQSRILSGNHGGDISNAVPVGLRTVVHATVIWIPEMGTNIWYAGKTS